MVSEKAVAAAGGSYRGVIDDERKAVRREKALVAARKQVQKRVAASRAAIIREELARNRGEKCTCAIKPSMTIEQLIALGAGCTAGRWVCPTLDAIRRRLGH